MSISPLKNFVGPEKGQLFMLVALKSAVGDHGRFLKRISFTFVENSMQRMKFYGLLWTRETSQSLPVSDFQRSAGKYCRSDPPC